MDNSSEYFWAKLSIEFLMALMPVHVELAKEVLRMYTICACRPGATPIRAGWAL